MADRIQRGAKSRQYGRNTGLYQSMKIDKLPVSNDTGNGGFLVGQSVDLA